MCDWVIFGQIYEVYDEYEMGDGMVRKPIRLFNEGENVHDEASND